MFLVRDVTVNLIIVHDVQVVSAQVILLKPLIIFREQAIKESVVDGEDPRVSSFSSPAAQVRHSSYNDFL